MIVTSSIIGVFQLQIFNTWPRVFQNISVDWIFQTEMALIVLSHSSHYIRNELIWTFQRFWKCFDIWYKILYNSELHTVTKFLVKSFYFRIHLNLQDFLRASQKLILRDLSRRITEGLPEGNPHLAMSLID